MSLLHALDEAAHAARAHVRTPLTPRIGIVLGSGLGAFGDELQGLTRIPYAEIPGMARSAVIGHAGNLCFGEAAGVPVACLQGRVHLYEGHPLAQVVFGVRLLARLGCRAVLLTNAAGGLNPDFAPGDLMLLTDHLNLTGQNPLVGPNDEALGPRFPDMTEAYDPRLREAARAASREASVPLREGIYAGLLGPTYETPAEVRMLRHLGADAVGMSTVLEVIALRHTGVPAAAISCITNLAAGLSPTKLDHREVEETARRTRTEFTRLLTAWVARADEALGPGSEAPGGAR